VAGCEEPPRQASMHSTLAMWLQKNRKKVQLSCSGRGAGVVREQGAQSSLAALCHQDTALNRDVISASLCLQQPAPVQFDA
jgi:hypothetical protein